MKVHHGDEGSIVPASGRNLEEIEVDRAGRKEQIDGQEEQQRPEGSRKAEVTQSRGTGFLFCPRCGHVAVDGGLNSFCKQCRHRFCASCSD